MQISFDAHTSDLIERLIAALEAAQPVEPKPSKHMTVELDDPCGNCDFYFCECGNPKGIRTKRTR